MTSETKDRILKALEGDYGRATDNAHRARARSRGATTAGEEAMRREYEREETAALAALKEFAPDWAPRRMFTR